MMLVAAALLAASLHSPTSQDMPLTSTDVTFTTADGQRLGGEILRPANATGPLPGLLLVHGSGGGNSRRELRAEAEAFAAQGMVVLAPDKRSAGYSKTHRDYGQLADDALAALAVLRKQPGVGPAGLWGISEGGWVAPIAATRSKDVDFLVTVGGPGRTPLRTQVWNATNKLDRAGVRGSLRNAYVSLHRLGADAGLFPEAYYDPAPTLGRLTVPVLAMWGTEDNQVMPAESAQSFRANVPGSLTVRFFPGASHSLHADDDTLIPGYADAVGTWVRTVAGGDAPPFATDPDPVQAALSVDTPPSAWWESWPVMLGGMTLLLLAFLSYAVRRLGAGTWAGRVLAATGALSMAGAVQTLMSLLMTSNGDGVTTGPMLLGRPVTWLAAQLLAAVATAATVVCLTRWRTASARMRVVTVAGALFVPWALYWGLLLP
ncbi:alpha/beta hydrolase family protein [Nonomuraea phyllanthi]|uniref:alpha/beta hydrolase family protein n=1 Tax=Nonomuraea phyllanthi TaxID=2219224 RepID=UPI001293FCA9|nr:prolyl oligopeptidase family serine peptidase [Nonomuraea phyllanthi]